MIYITILIEQSYLYHFGYVSNAIKHLIFFINNDLIINPQIVTNMIVEIIYF